MLSPSVVVILLQQRVYPVWMKSKHNAQHSSAMIRCNPMQSAESSYGMQPRQHSGVRRSLGMGSLVLVGRVHMSHHGSAVSVTLDEQEKVLWKAAGPKGSSRCFGYMQLPRASEFPARTHSLFLMCCLLFRQSPCVPRTAHPSKSLSIFIEFMNGHE